MFIYNIADKSNFIRKNLDDCVKSSNYRNPISFI